MPIYISLYCLCAELFYSHFTPVFLFTGHSGDGGQRRNPQGNVLAPVLGPGAEKVHHPRLLERLVQRLQPGKLPQAADVAHRLALQYVTFHPLFPLFC